MTKTENSSKWPKRALQVLLGVVAGAAIAEAAFWVRDGGAFPHLNCYLPDSELGVRLRPGATERLQVGKNPKTEITINAAGFRGDEWPAPSGKDVLVVGDSQVFGLGVEAQDTFSAKLSDALHAPVLNAGVPTYGPVEYNRLLEKLLAERKPATVIYTVNFVNDAFEARRPNTERHSVWDGWAVRKETAPLSITNFPGRELLYRKSHAVFALRQWLYKQGPELDDRGFRSEGTFKDLVDVADKQQRAKSAAKLEQDRLNRLHEVEARYATRAALAAELRVQLLAYTTLHLDERSNTTYLAAHANPGDIVIPQEGEEGRALSATTRYISDAVALRAKIEKTLREQAAKAPDDPRFKTAATSMQQRDALEKKLQQVLTQPLTLVRAGFPLLQVVEEAKLMTEKSGARFVLLVLPIDVQVSAEEWKKYGSPVQDMKKTNVLLHDLTAGIRDSGASALDATSTLKAALPGAFLDGDPHMTPKGHAAVAAALVKLLAEQPPPAKLEPALALPAGRSRVPAYSEWAKNGEIMFGRSDPAGCATKRIREWYFVHCKPSKDKKRIPTAARVVSGGHGEVLINASDSSVTLVAPVIEGDDFKARFSWTDHERDMQVHWPAGAAQPDMFFSDKLEGGAPESKPAPTLERSCECYRKSSKAESCGGFAATPDANCLASYGDDCQKLLECASGRALRMPQCPVGYLNAGAALHCYQRCDSGEKCARGSCVEKQGVKLCVEAGSGGPKPAKLGEVIALELPEPASEAELKAFEQAVASAMKASETAVKACHLAADSPGGWYDFEFYDDCSWKPADVSALRQATTRLQRLGKETPALLGDARADILRHLELFSDWLEFSLKADQSRGTLALYQELVTAHNAYRPEQPIPLDPPHIVREYHVKFPDRFVDYVLRDADYERHKSYGLPLRWLRGVHGPKLKS